MVPTPLAWQEAELALKNNRAGRLEFEPQAVLQRVREQGDLFAPVLNLKQELPSPTAVDSD